MKNLKNNSQGVIQLLTIIMITALSAACSSDDATGYRANPNNCTTPCLASAPDMSMTTVTSGDGATIMMTLDIAGDVSEVVLSNSTFYLESFDPSSNNGRLATSSNEVVSVEANTITMNFVIGTGVTVTGTFYPEITIGVADSQDPNFPDDPNALAGNNTRYVLESTSTVNYSFEEVIAGESSTYSSNGVFLDYTATELVIPIVTLQ